MNFKTPFFKWIFLTHSGESGKEILMILNSQFQQTQFPLDLFVTLSKLIITHCAPQEKSNYFGLWNLTYTTLTPLSLPKRENLNSIQIRELKHSVSPVIAKRCYRCP